MLRHNAACAETLDAALTVAIRVLAHWPVRQVSTTARGYTRERATAFRVDGDRSSWPRSEQRRPRVFDV